MSEIVPSAYWMLIEDEGPFESAQAGVLEVVKKDNPDEWRVGVVVRAGRGCDTSTGDRVVYGGLSGRKITDAYRLLNNDEVVFVVEGG